MSAEKSKWNSICDVEQSLNSTYQVIKRIGKGAYGTVWKAVHRRSNRLVAVKKIENAFENDVDAQRTFREINYLTSFKGHVNIIRLLTLHKANNNRDIYLIFEYMDIDLNAYIKKGYVLQESQIRYITYQVLRALKYVHSANVVHRDLKPANILINGKCQAKLADFGLARSLNKLQGSQNGIAASPLTEYVATRWYRPPEVLLTSKCYTTGVDIWSLGCIVAEMYRSVPLFPGTTTIHQLELILSAIPKGEDEFGSIIFKPNSEKDLTHLLISLTPEAKDLVKRLLILSPKNRISADEALNHIFFNRHFTNSEPKFTGYLELRLADCRHYPLEDYREAIYRVIEGARRYQFNWKFTEENRKRSQYEKRKTVAQVKPNLSRKQFSQYNGRFKDWKA